MGRLTDTSPEAERVLAAAYRAMSPARKWEILTDEQRLAPILHEFSLRLRNPSATPREVRASWLRTILGPGPWVQFPGRGMVVSPPDQSNVLREVIAALATLGVATALGGSYASSIHGSVRYTRAADVTAEPFPGKEAEFVACFGPEYDVSREAVEQAVRDHSCFNIIKPEIGFKANVFVRKDRPFERSVLARRGPSAVFGPDQPPLDVVSPEDIILLKLESYRLGGEVSGQQWNDVLGVLRVQAGRLDPGYLEHWAAELKVGDLLARARAKAEL